MSAITLTVPGNKWETFKKYFLMTHPNQTLESDHVLSDDDWIGYRVFLFARGSYQKGLMQEYGTSNGPDFDEDIISL